MLLIASQQCLKYIICYIESLNDQYLSVHVHALTPFILSLSLFMCVSLMSPNRVY